MVSWRDDRETVLLALTDRRGGVSEGPDAGLNLRAHVGVVREAFEVFAQDCRELAAELTEQEMDQLTQAKRTEYARDDEAAIKRLNFSGVNLGSARAGVEAAKLEINGGDLSIWSIVNGLTYHAKELASEEDRTELCTAAGHVLNSALAAA